MDKSLAKEDLPAIKRLFFFGTQFIFKKKNRKGGAT
jgi:hypothetical protein